VFEENGSLSHHPRQLPSPTDVLQGYKKERLIQAEKIGIQAGCKDFEYMKNMTSVAELREKIIVTGAEVWK
jgi:hypothetical protein